MRKINWGVLGTAGIAYKETIPGMKIADNCNLYAIAGRSIEKANDFKKTFGFEKAYGSYEELIADENVEAVYIPLPNHLHVEWIKKAAEAGKHILCEKPMAMNKEELKEAFETAKKNNVILMEAFAYLHNDAICAMVEKIKNGAVGKVRLIESSFFIRPPKDGDIRWIKEWGGGAVYDVGCYCISLAQRILGEMPESIDAISHFAESEVDDFCHMYFQYPSGAMATLGCGFVARERSERIVIHGDKASLWADIAFNQEGLCAFDIRSDEGSEHFEYNVKSNYALEVEQLGRCIADGEKPHVSEEFSLAVCDIIDRVLEKINY